MGALTADTQTGALFLKQYIFSKYEIDYYRMNHKCNAEKMFVKEGIQSAEYLCYLTFQIQSSFRVVGDRKRFRDAVKCRVDSRLKHDLLELGVFAEPGSNARLTESSEMPESLQLTTSFKSHGQSLLPGQQSTLVSSRRGSSRHMRLSRFHKSLDKSRRKRSLWSRLTANLHLGVSRGYQAYQVVTNLRFLRLNNLVFELAYFENRGPGRIKGFSDAVAFCKEGPLKPRVFVKKLDSFQQNHFQAVFERNEERHRKQFLFLLRKSTCNADHARLGVFYCGDKICELCGKKDSPFFLCQPMEIIREKSGFSIDSSTAREHHWLHVVLNAQAKNVFVFPCELLGKSFKDRFTEYLKSTF